MSQFPIPEPQLPLMPLEDDSDGAMQLDEHMMNLDLIEQALDSLGNGKPKIDTLPSYYDDMLMRLIDAVPLE